MTVNNSRLSQQINNLVSDSATRYHERHEHVSSIVTSSLQDEILAPKVPIHTHPPRYSLSVSCWQTEHKTDQNGIHGCCRLHQFATGIDLPISRQHKRRQNRTETSVTQSQKRRKGKQTCPCFWIRPISFPTFVSCVYCPTQTSCCTKQT